MADFDSNGIRIHYQEFGAGDPVMLVHGFASSADGNWGEAWYRFLAPHFRVIALDCRGHGKSDKPHDPAAYGGETMGDDVIRLLDHLGIGRALMMGYSMGARIVSGLLIHRAERLRAAVLGGIGAVSRSAPTFDRKPIVAALLSEDASGIQSQRAREFRQFAEANRNDLKALAACMGANRGDFTGEQIAGAGIRVPVMIVIGTKDVLVGDPKLLRDSIPGSRLLMLEGRDHLTAPGDPLYKQEVLKFFKSAPA